ncbi:hypothetical protein [Nostoc sp.]|uniref:hypothetical protein n=1 Tax=Nostoc sp. TaxID=1180 RepID=UPI002FF08B69
MKKATFTLGREIEMIKTQALDLGDEQNFAYEIWYTNQIGEKQRLARVRDELKANELFERYSHELKS